MFKRSKFTKPRFRTRSRARAPSTRQLQRSKASKRFNWVETLDNTCGVAALPPRACEVEPESQVTAPFEIDCATGNKVATSPALPVQFTLVPPAAPSGDPYASDDITIVRMVGSITLVPYYIMRAPALALFNATPDHLKTPLLTLMRKDRNYFVRAGLKKDQGFWDELTRTYTFPPRDPMQTDSWTDGQWQRIWTFETFPGQLGGHTASFQGAGNVIGVCSQVTGSGGGTTPPPDNTFTDGTGVIAIEPIDITTDCNFIDLTDSNGEEGVFTSPDRPLRINLSSRKRRRFKENEGLHLWVQYTTVGYENTVDPTCSAFFHDLAVGFMVRAHVKMLVET